MLKKKDQGVEWLEFELLADQPRLKHGIFLRHGGVSEGPFASLNVGGGTGDKELHIKKNREKVMRALGAQKFVSGKQVHGVEIAHVPASLEVGECDGLVTEQKEVALLIKHADCQAAIFYDPTLHVVANVHCGWRGNVSNIYKEAVKFLVNQFGSKPANLLVGVSPSLGPENSEFKNYQTEIPKSLWSFQIKPTYFDLWEISQAQLLELGLLPHHIEIARLCTFHGKEDYFSYRRDKVTGRHATLAYLK